MSFKSSCSYMLVIALLVAAFVPVKAEALPSRADIRDTPDFSAPHVPGQLLVKLASVPSAAGAGVETVAQLDALGVQTLATIPQLGLALVETGAGDSLSRVAAELVKQPAIEWAEPNYTFSLDLVPNDPLYATRQVSTLGRIQMPGAWDLSQGRPEVIIAVLDTGIDETHPDLAGSIWTNPGETPGNALDDDANGFVDDVSGWDFAGDDNAPADDHGHGTHVAGIAAARTDNGIGVAGVAGRATIMPLDVFQGGIGAYEDLIRAIVYATDNGARVINMSLGASSYSRGEEAAVNYAWSRGVVVVAAAGNTCNGSGDSRPPCLAQHYPAAHRNVIAVAATTADDVIAPFSTRGAFVDVAAPGVGVYSTYRGGVYTTLSGTSMAAPHVSGLAALVVARNPFLSPDQVRLLIELGTEDLGSKGPDVYFGYGRINAWRTLDSTPPDDRPYPTLPPAPPLDFTLAGCTELIPDGSFEAGWGAWAAAGSVTIDGARPYAGSQALHFSGGPGATGAVTRTLALPSGGEAGVLWFVYRIEDRDAGWGSDPTQPHDDSLAVELRKPDGTPVSLLLYTGNSADTAVDGLPWDRYLYRMDAVDLDALRAGGRINLTFTAANDADNAATDFWVDEVRFCVRSPEGSPYRVFLPFWNEPGGPVPARD